MKKLLSIITIIAIVGILATFGFFWYNKYQKVELEKNKLQDQQKENDDSDSQSISESANNESQSNVSQSNSQVQYTTDEQQVTKNNVFDYAISTVIEVGNADWLKFLKPVYSNGEWKFDANNKSGAGLNTIIIKDDGTLQIKNGPKTSMDYEIKIEL